MKRSIKAIVAAAGAAVMCAAPALTSVTSTPVVNSISASANYYPNLYETFDDDFAPVLSYYNGVSDTGVYSGGHADYRKISNNAVEVIKIDVADSRIKIPAQVKIGNKLYNVEKIADRAFQNKNGTRNGMGAALTKIDLSAAKYLTTIGDEAFQGCTGLTSITIPASVETIGTKAFQASGLQGIRLERASAYSLRPLVIKDSAFADLANLSYITNNVTCFTDIDRSNGHINATSNSNAFNNSNKDTVTIGTSYRVIGFREQFIDNFKEVFDF